LQAGFEFIYMCPALNRGIDNVKGATCSNKDSC
jgi:hypothetical protein